MPFRPDAARLGAAGSGCLGGTPVDPVIVRNMEKQEYDHAHHRRDCADVHGRLLLHRRVVGERPVDGEVRPLSERLPLLVGGLGAEPRGPGVLLPGEAELADLPQAARLRLRLPRDVFRGVSDLRPAEGGERVPLRGLIKCFLVCARARLQSRTRHGGRDHHARRPTADMRSEVGGAR